MATRDSKSGLRDVFVDGKGGRFPFRDKVREDGFVVLHTSTMKKGIEGQDIGPIG